MNSAFVVDRARHLVNQVPDPGQEGDRIAALYRRVYQRPASPQEIHRALEFIATARSEPPLVMPPPQPSLWSYGYGPLDFSAGRLKSFQPFPHFEKQSWQGSRSWPDARLGWARLTAQGGHPGMPDTHAVVRRWTAPKTFPVRLSGTLEHTAREGDGVLGVLLHSAHGLLSSWWAHHQKASTVLDPIEMKAGEWLDFIVDCRGGVDHDDFTWAPTLSSAQKAPRSADPLVSMEWSAMKDFSGPPPAPPEPLDAWSALAQALLVSNEAGFID